MKLTKTEVLILGAVLAAIEGVQLNISMSVQTHAVLTMAIVVMSGAGIQAITPTTFLASLPVQIAALISSLLGGFLVLSATFSLSSVLHTVIAVVVVIATALGVGPAPPAAAAAVIKPAVKPVTRLLGIPPALPGRPILSKTQLQKSYPPAVKEPLPSPYTPALVTPDRLGITDAATVQFVMFGDCGGVSDPNPQNLVANAILSLRQSGAINPAFALLVGDLVYFNGDPAQWAPQFYEPYCHSLGGVPIIAFPGNHDGDASDGIPGSGIASFLANMCTPSPKIPPGDPTFEYARHTQTLPSCDWALELEALTIIAVWTNVPSGGDLYPEQTAFLTAQLKAARPKIPVMVGVHHPPYSVDAHHGGSAKIGQAIDACIAAAGRCPDIVASGHVHDFQHLVRTYQGWKIPYIVSGNGGYHNLHNLASDATAGLQVDPETVFNYGDDTNYGFCIITAGGGKISGEYVSIGKDGTITRSADTF